MWVGTSPAATLKQAPRVPFLWSFFPLCSRRDQPEGNRCTIIDVQG